LAKLQDLPKMAQARKNSPYSSFLFFNFFNLNDLLSGISAFVLLFNLDLCLSVAKFDQITVLKIFLC
jgi:hypothetical protein